MSNPIEKYREANARAAHPTLGQYGLAAAAFGFFIVGSIYAVKPEALAEMALSLARTLGLA